MTEKTISFILAWTHIFFSAVQGYLPQSSHNSYLKQTIQSGRCFYPKDFSPLFLFLLDSVDTPC